MTEQKSILTVIAETSVDAIATPTSAIVSAVARAAFLLASAAVLVTIFVTGPTLVIDGIGRGTMLGTLEVAIGVAVLVAVVLGAIARVTSQ